MRYRCAGRVTPMRACSPQNARRARPMRAFRNSAVSPHWRRRAANRAGASETQITQAPQMPPRFWVVPSSWGRRACKYQTTRQLPRVNLPHSSEFARVGQIGPLTLTANLRLQESCEVHCVVGSKPDAPIF